MKNTKQKILNFIKNNFIYLKDNSQTFHYIKENEIQEVVKNTIEIDDKILEKLKTWKNQEIIEFLEKTKNVSLIGKIKTFFSRLITLKGINFIYNNIEKINHKGLKIIIFILIKNENSISIFLKKVPNPDKNFKKVVKNSFSLLRGSLKEEQLINLLNEESFNKNQKLEIFNNLLFTDLDLTLEAELLILKQALDMFTIEDIAKILDKNKLNKDIFGKIFSTFFELYYEDTSKEGFSHFVEILKNQNFNFLKTTTILNKIKKLYETNNLDMAYLYDISPELLMDYTYILSLNT